LLLFSPKDKIQREAIEARGMWRLPRSLEKVLRAYEGSMSGEAYDENKRT
jgi:hypothetical protein